jgi:hypothetical protein
MNEHLVKLFGTEEPLPERRLLRAGPLTATLEDGMLRWISVGGIEVIRAIAFLIRDRNWSTCIPEITNFHCDESGGGFRISFDALCRTPDGELPWHADIEGRGDGTVRFDGVATPAQDVLTCRTGFVILHPLQHFVGQPIEILHTDGRVSQTHVPLQVDPDQPFMDVRAMTHEPVPGLRATIRMEGDTWETEDHRNWTDASFKTYVRPLALPWPYTIPGGTEIRQSVTLSFEGDLSTVPAPAHGPVRISIGGEAGVMPSIGLSVLPEDAEAAVEVTHLVAQLGPQHLACRIDLRDPDWATPLAAYRVLDERLSATVLLEVIIPGDDPVFELKQAADSVDQNGLRLAAVIVTPAVDLVSYPPGTPFPPSVSWEDLFAAARDAFAGVRLGGGMLANFTELNRKRLPAHLVDFVSHATSHIVHAADDRSVMETLESLEHIIRSTRAIAGAETPYRIGPSHIGNSYNPYGKNYTENPENIRVTMARVEPRHRGLFGAAWHLGFVSQAAAGGLEAVTLASPAGEFGVAATRQDHARPWYDENEGAVVYPVFHVLRGMAAAAGQPRIEAQSSDTNRLRCVAYRDRDGIQLWLANLRDAEVGVALDGLAPKAVWTLDESSFASAVADAGFGDRNGPASGDSLTLQPFAVVRVTL